MDYGFDITTPLLSHADFTNSSKDKSFADDQPYDDKTNYAFDYPGVRLWFGPCLYSKAADDYVTRDSVCDVEYAFYCQWEGKDMMKNDLVLWMFISFSLQV